MGNMDELETYLDFMVLKYVKENEPEIDDFHEYIDEISYGFDRDAEDYESRYREKKMITAGNYVNLVLTSFGETVLKNIQRKNRKEWVQTWVPAAALAITTGTLIFSIVIGF